MIDYRDRFHQIRTLWGIAEDRGYPETSLTPWREHFGAVPAALAEYYLSLGTHRELNETQDALIVPNDAPSGYHRLRDVPGTDHLVFYVENQWALMWAISPDDVRETDPVVQVSGDGIEWTSTGDTVSEFLLAQAHMQRVLSYEHSSEEYWEIGTDSAASIRERFSLLAASGMYEGVEFYGRPGETIMVNHTPDGFIAWFGADDEARFGELLAWFQRLEE